MRLRQTLKIINWAAAATVLAVLIIGKDKDYAWIGIVVLAAVSLHFLIETVVMLKRGRFRRLLSDLSEYREHQQFSIKDLEGTFASDAPLSGVAIPAILTGTVVGGQEKKAPISGKKAIAWRVVAEPLESMAKVGGQVILVDSYWGEMSLKDGTGTVPLSGPGVLDGSSLTERVYTLKNLRGDLPEIAARVEDGLGIIEGKETKSVPIALREIALCSADKVLVYGKVDQTSGRMVVSGTDRLDDAGSLLVRAAGSPASTRIPRRTLRTIVFASVTVCLLAGLGVFASQTVIAGMFKPGGILDPSRTAKISLDLDGRPLRITIGDSHWDFTQGDMSKALALLSNNSPFQGSRESPVKVQLVGATTRIIGNGDADYPRWDGTAWVFDAAGRSREAAAEAGPSGSGRLFVRNLTGALVTLRVLSRDGSPVVDTSWNFQPYEAANDPQGHYLELTGKGAVPVSRDNRLEIIMKNGSHRIVPLAAVAKWVSSGSWLFEMVPERLAGTGKIFVKNSGEAPIRLWLIGADGQVLYGQDPWTFESKEGTSENRGLRLQFDDKDIMMTGREAVKLEVQDLRTVYDGPLQRIARWRRGSWTIDLAQVVR
jgi:hypothetical protein